MRITARRGLAFVALAATATLGLTACGSGFSSGSSTSGSGTLTSSNDPLTVMIGSSGDAETKAVTAAVDSWSQSSGTKATVVAASNLSQQLSQGFAAGKPADVFYLSTDALAGYASNGSLLAYGDQLANKSDFYPSLVSSFTYDGKFYCAPKDFSTLQLIVNTDMWQAAGLTDSDYPKTWDDLTAVAKKLTTAGHVGLGISGEYARIGSFMVQAGGNLMNDDSTQATANSTANVQALDYVKQLLNGGELKYAKDLGAGWGGEAFGKGLAAMTIEGNWITGAMSSDYPNVKYKVVELLAGPAGQGTLQFTNCWGIAADSPNQAAALKLVEQLTSKDSQLAFSKAFGVMPSITSAADEWKSENAALVPFLDAASYAKGVPTAKGSADVVTDLNSKLESLATSDPQTILDATQTNLQALLAK
ncbi:MAG: extracellular solute-binding protein [Microbacterium ginsengisoli]|uniref:sugar ABC transporter substrate-binding protein n=1 Tax=Microbacterium TaxID=33882 RepID=UPI0006FFBE7F|nr:MULTISPECIES: extracellular solute-binding protein [unclassified Microbacterium]KQR98352.1 sugar ABC transporter substrate-binding protein [Microbacterium sp. Leaf347]KQR98406.1 sugar ABC transporter substrate-binding protein [Microbacterium sp. Leaf351]MBN9199698.1 extracellular solute-binding protein [Microbacterium ginsengisoli]OJU74511.1 MAG: ABC transporter substrate-binding protein [Microbacterium sp. 71-23]